MQRHKASALCLFIDSGARFALRDALGIPIEADRVIPAIHPACRARAPATCSTKIADVPSLWEIKSAHPHTVPAARAPQFHQARHEHAFAFSTYTSYERRTIRKRGHGRLALVSEPLLDTTREREYELTSFHLFRSVYRPA